MDTIENLSTVRKPLPATAKEFANELTRHNVIEKDLTTSAQILKEHSENNTAVRNILLQRGVRP